MLWQPCFDGDLFLIKIRPVERQNFPEAFNQIDSLPVEKSVCGVCAGKLAEVFDQVDQAQVLLLQHIEGLFVRGDDTVA